MWSILDKCYPFVSVLSLLFCVDWEINGINYWFSRDSAQFMQCNVVGSIVRRLRFIFSPHCSHQPKSLFCNLSSARCISITWSFARLFLSWDIACPCRASILDSRPTLDWSNSTVWAASWELEVNRSYSVSWVSSCFWNSLRSLSVSVDCIRKGQFGLSLWVCASYSVQGKRCFSIKQRCFYVLVILAGYNARLLSSCPHFPVV